MARSRVLGLVVVASIALVTGAAAAWEDYLFVQNFRTIDEGALYRGAEQRPGPLRRLIANHGIRTIVCLAEPEPNERAVAESLGVAWYHVPISESGASVTFDRLEQAARIVADPNHQPVFFHCKRGVYRSNLLHAVYRLKHCRWPLDQLIAELRRGGYSPERSGGDSSCGDLIARYYRERVEPTRASAAANQAVPSN